MEKQLEEILSDFDREEIKYCLMRNFNKKQLESSHDIDILVDSYSFPKIKSLLLARGFKQIFSAPTPNHEVFLNLINNRFINLDLHVGGVPRDGILLLSSEDIIKRRIKLKNFYVPSEEDYTLCLLLHCIVDKKKFKEFYKKEVMKVLAGNNFNHKYLEASLKKNYPLTFKRFLDNLNNRNFNKLLEMRNYILFERALLYPRGLLGFAQIYAKRLFKILNPFWQGPLVVFSGKLGETEPYIQTLRESLENGALRVYYFKFDSKNTNISTIRDILKIFLFRKLGFIVILSNPTQFLSSVSTISYRSGTKRLVIDKEIDLRKLKNTSPEINSFFFPKGIEHLTKAFWFL